MKTLPEGWTGFVGGIATNTDPVNGGIIDRQMLNPNSWFVIPNDETIPMIEDLPSQEAAFEYLTNALKGPRYV